MANQYENQEIDPNHLKKKYANKNEGASSLSIYTELSDVRFEEKSVYSTLQKPELKNEAYEADNKKTTHNKEKKLVKRKYGCKVHLFVIIFVFFIFIFAVSISIFSIVAYTQINNLKLQVSNIKSKELEYKNNISIKNKCKFNISLPGRAKHLVTLANIVHCNTSNYINTIIESIGQHEYNPATSCLMVYYFHLYASSGYFWIHSGNREIIQVYCKKERYQGYISSLRVWMRVAKLNKSNNSAECFPGLQQYSLNKSSCVAPSDSATCSHTYFSTFNNPYFRVHFVVRAYGIRNPDGFTSRFLSINDNYVDGISFTYGVPPNRHHISTFVADVSYYCYSNAPRFVRYHACLKTYTTSVPLCSGSTCSKSSFVSLDESTDQDIEMRVCRNSNRNGEDIVIEDIELYVQ